ncbi:MAG: transcriptional regulator [Deferribacteraceae bacterium]|jgi:predicted DNA-binding transcriptional regulator YafY|nr:transcriptional regulator [Deferribacteraceae bacterium]
MADINLNVALQLLKVLSSHRLINYKTIMDEFKVSRKTAYRYLEKIEEHFPVYTPYYEGGWYLLAEHSGIFKTFLVNAIEKIKPGGGFFKPDHTAMEKYASEAKNIWQIPNNRIETVTVQINKAVVDNFKRRSIFPHQHLIKIENNGDLTLTFGVTTDMEFKQLIMPWFPEFKIIKPVKYKKLLDDMIKQYLNS